jgi:hypothetical protein
LREEVVEMALVIEVTPEVETRLQAAAAKRGLSVTDYAKDLLVLQPHFRVQ